MLEMRESGQATICTRQRGSNLTPSVGELNGDRSNKPYGVVPGNVLAYGKCDFKIGGKPSSCEPRKEVKEDAARIWFYMAETYKIKLSAAQRTMFEEVVKS